MNTYSKMTDATPAVNLPAVPAGSTSDHANTSPPPMSQHAAQQHPPQADAETRSGSLSPAPQFEDWGGVRKCGPVTLSRTRSSASQRFRGANERANGGSSGVPAAMRRAFSMRRPSSLAEGYWRIHDTGDEDLQQEGDPAEEQNQQQQHTKSASSGRKKKKGMILKAWKKLFGF